MPPPVSDLAFSPTVKAEQEKRGSRRHYARADFRSGISAELELFLEAIDTAFLCTVNADGQPYAQHRGGPKGFIRALDRQTLGFADLEGNRQYVTLGNLQDEARAFLFLMDYERRRRVKLWGQAHVVEDDETLLRRLRWDGMPYSNRAILFTVKAWDANCPAHIPRKLDAESAEGRIAALEAENRRLRALLPLRRPEN